jgi:hypothetical protein
MRRRSRVRTPVNAALPGNICCAALRRRRGRGSNAELAPRSMGRATRYGQWHRRARPTPPTDPPLVAARCTALRRVVLRCTGLRRVVRRSILLADGSPASSTVRSSRSSALRVLRDPFSSVRQYCSRFARPRSRGLSQVRSPPFRPTAFAHTPRRRTTARAVRTEPHDAPARRGERRDWACGPSRRSSHPGTAGGASQACGSRRVPGAGNS